MYRYGMSQLTVCLPELPVVLLGGMVGISKTMSESYYQDHQGTKDKASNTTN